MLRLECQALSITLCRLQTSLLACGESLVEFQIQFKNVDARLSEETELSVLGMFCDQWAQLSGTRSAFFSDTRQLELRRRGCDMGIEPGCRSCHQVDRHGHGRIFGLRIGHLCFHSI